MSASQLAGKAASAQNSTRHGLRSAKYQQVWKQLSAIDKQRQQLFESNNFANFSEEHDERTIQILEILQNGETVTFESPPIQNPDGSVSKIVTTLSRSAPGWLIEAILDGKI